MGTHEMQSPSVTIASLVREDGYGTKAILTLSGRWCGNLYGYHVGKSLRVQYRPVGTSSWEYYYLYNNSDGSVGYSSLSGVYELNDITFDSGTAYEVRVLAYNGLGWGSYSATETLSLGTPLLFLDEYQDGVGINCFPTGKGLSVDGFGRFTGSLTAHDISLSGSLVTSGYIESYSDLYISGNTYVAGNIYRNGYLSLDTGNIGSQVINFNAAVSNGYSPILFHNWNDPDSGYIAGIGYDTYDYETITLWTKQSNGRLIFNSGTNFTTLTPEATRYLVPDFEVQNGQIKKNGNPVPAVFIQSSAPDSTNLKVGDIWFVL